MHGILNLIAVGNGG